MNNYDVIVIGAGSAGVIAALSSARSGAKTLIIEETSTFGGTNTNALVGPLVPFIGENKEQIVNGIPQEIIDKLISLNGSKGHVNDPIGFAHSLTPVDFKMLQVVQTNLINKEENITVQLNESVIETRLENNIITSVITKDRYGLEKEYRSKVFIDATGDADIIAMSGAEFEIGRETDGKVQPMTMVFSLGNVDLESIRDDVSKNPDNFAVSDEIKNGERMEYVAVSGYFNEVRNSESFPIVRDRLLFFEGVQPNEVFVNTTRVLNKNNLNSQELTDATLEGNTQVLELFEWMRKNIAPFKNSHLIDVGTIGVRESRRIVGKKTLIPMDVLSGAKQEKSIAVGSYPIDVHSPDSAQMEFIEEKTVKNYEIDLDMITPIALKNVLVAGRAISATHEAHASSRVSVTCMAIGQSAGVAGAIAARNKGLIEEINYEELKKEILNLGGVIQR